MSAASGTSIAYYPNVKFFGPVYLSRMGQVACRPKKGGHILLFETSSIKAFA
jgi:hypothetical protein